MTRRTLKWLLLAPVTVLLVLVVVVLVAAYGILHTEPGARWLIMQVDKAVPGVFEVGKLEGNLGDGLVLERAGFTDETLRVVIERVELSAGIKLLPPTIEVRRLRLSDSRIQQLEAGEADSIPLDLEQLLSSLSLPITVELDELEAVGIEIIGPGGETALTVESLAAQARLKDQLEIELLEVVIPQATLALRGGLGFSAPFPVNAVIDAELAEPLDNGLDEMRLQAALEGELNHYQLTTSAVLAAPEAGLEPTTIDMFGEGDKTSFEIASLTVYEQWLELAANGDIQWSDELQFSLNAGISRLRPEIWLEQWPADETLTGQIDFSLSGAGMLKLSEAHLQTANSGMRLQASGLIDLVRGIAEGDIGWDGLGWPLDAPEPDVISRQGKVMLTGSPGDWQLNGTASLRTRDLPEGELSLAATGDKNCVKLNSLEGMVFGGHVAGRADYCWTGEGAFNATLAATGLSTDPLFKAWPGKLNMQVETSGRTEPLEATIRLGQLDGIIRDLPLIAVGGIRWTANDLSLDDFRVSSGNSRIELDGSLMDRKGVSFLADIDTLDSLLPGSTGAIKAQGQVSLDLKHPRLRLELAAKDLSIDQLSIDRLEIRDAGQLADSSIADLQLVADQVHLYGQALDQFGLELGFSQDSQQLKLHAVYADMGLSAGIHGALESTETFSDIDWSVLSSIIWKGELEHFQLSENERPEVSLTGPAPVELSQGNLSITSACLTAGQSSSLCLDADWTDNGPFSAAMKLQAIPLQLVQRFIETDLEFSQEINGDVAFRMIPGEQPSGRASLTISPGDIRFPDDSEALFNTGEGHAGFNLDEGSLTAGNFDIPLPGNGFIDLDLEIPDVSAAGDGAINGQVQVFLEDLGFLPYFVSGIDLAQGRLQIRLELGGTVKQPSSRGIAMLDDGVIENHAIGLRLSDIQLSGETNGTRRVDLMGNYSAIEGQGELFATIDARDLQAPRIDLVLSGDRLTLTDAEDFRIVAVPDIQLGWQNGTLELGGSLEIPSARIAPAFIPTNSVSVSPDQVIVAGEITRLVEEEDEAPAISIQGDIDVILGDDVELDLSLAVVQMGGEANFSWQDELVPIANGGFTMVGQIQAFGQLLRITDGVIGWPGVAANNPQLNIQAERRIYGNSEIRRAGVFVTGTLRRLVVEPFTDPMTNRERARTLLITGSDFNMEKGVGAVDVGTYIAPRLFVSYGIGVFEDDNVIGIRYDLGRNWGVKATSGQRGTGLDISYTIER